MLKKYGLRYTETAAFKKYRHLIYAATGWLIFLIFFFSLKFHIEPRHYIHCCLDDYIPFVRWFFIIYCLWYFYLFAALLYFGLFSKSDFIKLQSYLFLGMGICLAVYVIFPNGITFRPAITQEDLISRVMAGTFLVDPPNMVTPSMHVFSSIAVHLSLLKSRYTNRKKPLIALSFVLMVLICASTVLVKQHSVIDVVCGVALAIALYFPVYKIHGAHTQIIPFKNLKRYREKFGEPKKGDV